MTCLWPHLIMAWWRGLGPPWASLPLLYSASLALAPGHSRAFPPSGLPPMVFLLPFSSLWGPLNLSFLPEPSPDLWHSSPCRGAQPSCLPGLSSKEHMPSTWPVLPQGSAAYYAADEVLCLPGRPAPPRLAQLGSPGVTAERCPIKLCATSNVCSVDFLKTHFGGTSRCVVLPFCTLQRG